MLHPLLVSAAPGVVVRTMITLEGSGAGLQGENGAAATAEGAGGSAAAGDGGAGQRRGVLTGLHLRHFYDTAVEVLGGHWVLERCVIESARGEQRACAGVVVRGGARLELRDCVIKAASSAVLLSSAHCALRLRGCHFANTRAAIVSERGGHVDVRGCTFSVSNAQDVGLRLHSDTTGAVVNNAGADWHSLWGPVVPPVGVEVDPVGVDQSED